MENQIPYWKFPGFLVDFQVNLNNWKVAKVVTSTATQITINTDELDPGRLENISQYDLRIQKYRSHTRDQNEIQPSFPFHKTLDYSRECLREKIEKLNEFLENQVLKESTDMKKYIFSEHLPFLFTLNNKIFHDEDEVEEIFIYQKLHFKFLKSYLKLFLSYPSTLKFVDSDYGFLFEGLFEISSEILKTSVRNSDAIIDMEFVEPRHLARFLEEEKIFSDLLNFFDKIKSSVTSLPFSFLRLLLRFGSYFRLLNPSKDLLQFTTKFQELFSILIKQDKPILENQYLEVYETFKALFAIYKDDEKVFSCDMTPFYVAWVRIWERKILSSSSFPGQKRKAMKKLRKMLEEIINTQIFYVNENEFLLLTEQCNEENNFLFQILTQTDDQVIIEEGFILMKGLIEGAYLRNQSLPIYCAIFREKKESLRSLLNKNLLQILERFREIHLEDYMEFTFIEKIITYSKLQTQIDVSFLYAAIKIFICCADFCESGQRLLNFLQKRVQKHPKEFNIFLQLVQSYSNNFEISPDIVNTKFDEINNDQSLEENLIYIERILKSSKILVRIQNSYFSILLKCLYKILSMDYNRKYLRSIQAILISFSNLKAHQMNEFVFLKLFKLFSKAEQYKDLFYKWILNNGDLSFPYTVNICIDDQKLGQIFDQLFTKNTFVQNQKMNPKEFELFRILMLEVNEESSITKYGLQEYPNFTYFRVVKFQNIIGLEILWDIFSNNTIKQTVQKAEVLLRDLFLSVSEKTGEEGKRFLVSFLKTIKMNLKKEEKEIKERCIELLKEILYELKGKYCCMQQVDLPLQISKIRASFPYSQDEEVYIMSNDTLYKIKMDFKKRLNTPYENICIRNSKDEIIPWQTHRISIKFIRQEWFKDDVLIVMLENYHWEVFEQFLYSFMSSKIKELITRNIMIKETFDILNELSDKANILKEILVEINQNFKDFTQTLKIFLLRSIESLHSFEFISVVKSNSYFEQELFWSEDFNEGIKNQEQISIIQENIKILRRYVEIEEKNKEKIGNSYSCWIKSLIDFISSKSQLSNIALETLSLCMSQLLNSYKDHALDKLIQMNLLTFCFEKVFIICPFKEVMEKFCAQIIRFLEKVAKNFEGELTEPASRFLLDLLFTNLYPTIGYDIIRLNYILILGTLAVKFSPKDVILCFSKDHLIILDGIWENLTIEGDDGRQDHKNILFEGHLELLYTLMKKCPIFLDKYHAEYLFYKCLFYDESKTGLRQTKCLKFVTMHKTLKILQKYFSSNLIDFPPFLRNLMKLQRNNAWRNENSWHLKTNEKMISHTQKYVGLQNLGNTCYLNTFVQLLYMNTTFKNYILDSNPMEVDGKDYSALQEMKKLFRELNMTTMKKYTSPINLIRALNKNFQTVILNQQEDINEFGIMLFDRIKQCFPEENNFINNLFNVTTVTEIKCQKCLKTSKREESHLILNLELKNNIEESFQEIQKVEILDEENAYFCDECQEKVRAERKEYLKKVSPYLIMCLKRFSYNASGQAIKLDKKCTFDKNISLHQYVSEEKQNSDYELKGVVIHYGSTIQCGHYYTFIKDEKENWYRFDDHNVKLCQYENIEEEAFGGEKQPKNAYLLLYQRKNIQQEKMIDETSEKRKELIQNSQLKLFFSNEYISFVTTLGKRILKEYEEQSQLVRQTFIELFLLITFKKQKNFKEIIKNMQPLQQLLLQNDSSLYYFMTIFSNKSILYEFFQECPCQNKKHMLARFVLEIIESKYHRVKKMKDSLMIFFSFVHKMVICFLQICSKSNLFPKFITFMLVGLCEMSYFHHIFQNADALNIVLDNLLKIPNDFTEEKNNLKSDLPEKVVQINILPSSMGKKNLSEIIMKEQDQIDGWRLIIHLVRMSKCEEEKEKMKKVVGRLMNLDEEKVKKIVENYLSFNLDEIERN